MGISPTCLEAADWIEKYPLSRRTPIAYDARRVEVVVFAGETTSPYEVSDTWVWTGMKWSKKTPVHHPPCPGAPDEATRLRDFGLVYDDAREQTVLFGGNCFNTQETPSNETWVWNGSDWTQKSVGTGPSPRRRPAMAYDAGRREVVMFGGSIGESDVNVLTDTWVWDGERWTQKQPRSTPPSTSLPRMAYDAARQQVVLYDSDCCYAPMTWVWDGNDWTEKFPATQPDSGGSSMAYDAAHAQVVMQTDRETWLWDGNNWTAKLAPSSPGSSTSLTYDSARSRIIGLWGSEIWTWDGNTWTREFAVPPPRTFSLKYDPLGKQVVMNALATGNSMTSWLWDVDRWTEDPTLTIPPCSNAAYDSLRRQQVCVVPADNRLHTWVSDGNGWVEKFTAMSPPYRARFLLAYDPGRSQTVLYGGSIVDWSNPRFPKVTDFFDTWVWDGSNWSQRMPATTPKLDAGLTASDSSRGQIVNVTTYSSDAFDKRTWVHQTWIWDGLSWVLKLSVPVVVGEPPGTGTNLPNPLFFTPKAIAEDLARGLVLLFGTDYLGQVQLYSWDGNNWTLIPVGKTPSRSRLSFQATYDPVRGQAVLFGNYLSVGSPSLDDTWTLDLTSGSTGDATAPVTTALLAGPHGESGWYTGPVKVTLVATDADGPSDVVVTKYSVDSGPLNTYGGPFDISGDGTHTIQFGSTDRAGNAETRRTLTFSIDATAPGLTCVATPNTLWPPNGKPAAVALSGLITDSGSGVDPASLAYSVMDEYGLVQPKGGGVFGPTGAYSIALSLTADRLGNDGDGRKYTISILGKDKAGNVASCSMPVTVPHDSGR